MQLLSLPSLLITLVVVALVGFLYFLAKHPQYTVEGIQQKPTPEDKHETP